MQRDESAAAQVLALLTAGLLFLGVVGYLLTQSAAPGHDATLGEGQRSAALDKDADALASLLAGSAGAGWLAGPDGVTRLGLASANGTLDGVHLAAIEGASDSQSLANGKVDYPDARAGFGLRPDQDFHLRVDRVGEPAEGAGIQLAGIRTAYIGDWTSLASITVPISTPTAMLANAQAQLNTTMFSTVATERAMLRNLGVSFNDKVFISTLAPTILVSVPLLPDPPILTYLNLPLVEGDVYPDVKAYLDANLPSRLAEYDLLVIGSGVQHSAMTGNAVKDGIANWVNAGGRLVVFGSDSANYQWLQPMFQSSISSVTGPVTATDPNHAILTDPYTLAWTSYDTHGLAWDIKKTGGGAHYNGFDHIVVQGGYDVLAISKPGEFGAGYVALSSFRPRELAPAEADKFVINLIQPPQVAILQDLGYGPAVPTDRAVSAAERTMTLWEAGQPVTVILRVYVWG